MRLLDAEHGKDCLGALALLLPTPLKFVALRRLFGWEIAPSAQIGLSLFVNVREIPQSSRDGKRYGSDRDADHPVRDRQRHGRDVEAEHAGGQEDRDNQLIYAQTVDR